MSTAATVFRKELKDALRDRRTWLIVLVTSILAGPLTLFLLSIFIASVEEGAAKREIYVANAAAAPTLINFLQRAGATVKDAPDDYAAQIKSGRLQNAVIVVPDQFEQRLAAGETIRLPVTFDETATRAQPATRATLNAVRGFARELGVQRLLARGVSPQVMAAVEIEEINVASSQARGAQLLFLIPWLALLGSVAGAISVAIDVTAGERERGSLEPLLMNPVAAGAVVLGKWAVVALCSAAVVILTLIGFKTAMQFIRSENLSALMQFGFSEFALFIVMLLPFSAMIASLNMLAATYGRSHKEAQTYATYLAMLVNFTPIVPLFISIRDAAWQLFVPAMAQQAVMMRALRGETVTAVDILLPGGMASNTACPAARRVCFETSESYFRASGKRKGLHSAAANDLRWFSFTHPRDAPRKRLACGAALGVVEERSHAGLKRKSALALFCAGAASTAGGRRPRRLRQRRDAKRLRARSSNIPFIRCITPFMQCDNAPPPMSEPLHCHRPARPARRAGSCASEDDRPLHDPERDWSRLVWCCLRGTRSRFGA